MTTFSARSSMALPTYPTIPHMDGSVIARIAHPERLCREPTQPYADRSPSMCATMARVSATPVVPPSGSEPTASVPSPYVDFTRDDWAARRENHPLSLTPGDIARVRGLGDRVDLREVE